MFVYLTFVFQFISPVTQLACSITLLPDALGPILGMFHDTNTLELHELGTPGQEQHHSIKTSTRIFTEDF
jgi:hypothetical protein